MLRDIVGVLDPDDAVAVVSVVTVAASVEDVLIAVLVAADSAVVSSDADVAEETVVSLFASSCVLSPSVSVAEAISLPVEH